LHAVAELKKRGLPIRLDIAGKELTDVTRGLIEQLALGDTVRLLGEVPRQTVLQLLRDADVEAHWIDVQGIGSAGMEAMALGLPVVAWGYEGIYGDVPLKHLQNIVFVNPDDHDALVGTLEVIVQDAGLRRRIGASARDTVRDWLTWKSVAARLESAYERAKGA
jgi:glycosyltransferase involved in cell wall biosynthesis